MGTPSDVMLPCSDVSGSSMLALCFLAASSLCLGRLSGRKKAMYRIARSRKKSDTWIDETHRPVERIHPSWITTTLCGVGILKGTCKLVLAETRKQVAKAECKTFDRNFQIEACSTMGDHPLASEGLPKGFRSKSSPVLTDGQTKMQGIPPTLVKLRSYYQQSYLFYEVGD